MKILKFGGTSIGTPEHMRQVAKLIEQEAGNVVVLSALSKTTDALVSIAAAISRQDSATANAAVDALKSHYDQFVQELYQKHETRKQGQQMVDSHFEFIRSFTTDVFTVHEERTILAQGELMSTALMHFYLQEIGIKSVLLPALDFMRIDENGEPDKEYIKTHLTALLQRQPNDAVVITQGYICRNSFGEVDNLKRGGSDYTASLIGAALRSEEIQIWTDIDGLHNSDPRYVSATQPVRKLSFEEAAELAYFGAKILHPASLRPARELDIPVRLLNTLDPTAPGTVITTDRGEGEFKAVAAKDGIIAIKIKSSRMFLTYGFLRRVFEVFERYKTPIDMITTSEIAVSLTIDDPTNLESIVKELQEFGTVEVDRDQTIICVVGDLVAEKAGVATRIFEPLQKIPLRMISYGGSRNNISVLVKSEHKAEALNALHRGLFLEDGKIED